MPKTVKKTEFGTREEEVVDKTIKDFGEQWTSYKKNKGYYGSTDCFIDIVGDLVSADEIHGKSVADIGSGTGRIVNMLLDLEARQVTAIEPSDAFVALKSNTASRQERGHLIHDRGEAIEGLSDLDMVFSIGVLHHIVEPDAVMLASHKALREGGKMIIWLYAYEGNELYLSVFSPLRAVTTKLPHLVLSIISHFLCSFLNFYVLLCKHLSLPMRSYMLNHIGKLSYENRHLTIYDQLNPTYAKYYRKEEVLELFQRNGFENVRIFRRHGYSWTASGEKQCCVN